MADRALALVPNPDSRKRRVGGGGDEDIDASLAPGSSSSDPSLALVVPATGGPAITKAEYEKRLKDVSEGVVVFEFVYDSVARPLPLSRPPPPPPSRLELPLSLRPLST